MEELKGIKGSWNLQHLMEKMSEDLVPENSPDVSRILLKANPSSSILSLSTKKSESYFWESFFWLPVGGKIFNDYHR